MVESYQGFQISEEEEEQTEESSIKQIVLSHIKRIGQICCKEFTGGYWQKKPVKTQGGIFFSEMYIEDTREEYCNAINFLTDIVYPLSDKKFKEYIDTFKEKEDEADINKKVKQKRKIFQEINIMFERVGFFSSSEFRKE